MSQKQPTIIDVRSRFELFFGRIKGAYNIPLNKIPDQIADIKKLPKPIIVCCASGNRSGMAVEIMKSHGISCKNGGSWTQVKQTLDN